LGGKFDYKTQVKTPRTNKKIVFPKIPNNSKITSNRSKSSLQPQKSQLSPLPNKKFFRRNYSVCPMKKNPRQPPRYKSFTKNAKIVKKFSWDRNSRLKRELSLFSSHNTNELRRQKLMNKLKNRKKYDFLDISLSFNRLCGGDNSLLQLDELDLP